MKPVRIALFASGTGSNAETLVQKVQKDLQGKVTIEFVLTDQPKAGVLLRVAPYGVSSYVVERVSTRKDQEAQILELLKRHEVQWIFLAGYMRVLSAEFLQTFSSWQQGHSQIVNIHPSLLPLYPGMNSLERAYNEGAKEVGVTLHLVDEGVDTGPILRQERLTVLPGEELSQLKVRLHQLEHQIYTDYLQSLVEESSCAV